MRALIGLSLVALAVLGYGRLTGHMAAQDKALARIQRSTDNLHGVVW